MKTLRAILCLIAVATASPILRGADTDAQVAARRVALDLAGAFSNDGFKIRDGHWAGPVKQGEQAVVAVNLYAGNQYWFSVGADSSMKKLVVHLYDENGQSLSTENFEGEDKAAAGFSPAISGQYFVSIDAVEGDASTFCLVYSYK